MKLTYKIGVFLLIVSLGLFFGYQRITSFPSHIHAWAEGGQYAIALGFLDNGFDFFHPETYVLNPQFPGKQGAVTETGITAVDFPIFQYGAAIVMKLTGNTSPLVYRLLVFLYSCLGLYFLFRFIHLMTNSFIRALFAMLFVLSSPIFVYYQTGMLISMPALCTAFIAFYYLLNYFKTQKYAHFLWAIALIVLASAMRTTYIISFFAIGLWFLVDAFKRKRFTLKLFIPMLIGMLFILGYRYYNFMLAQEYGSIFLNKFLMAEDLNGFIDYMNLTWKSWSLDYYSITHYIILGFALKFGSLIYINKQGHIPEEKKNVFFISVASILASIVFLICMSQQFPQHDYYFLDTFFLPISLLFILGLSLIPPLRGFYWKYLLVLAIIIPASMHAFEVQQKRSESKYWNELTSTVSSLEDADEMLTCLGFDKSAKVLIAGAHGSNLPLILAKRKGYTLLRNSKQNFDEAFLWNFDCVLIPQNLFLDKIYPKYPEIIHELKRVGGNEKLGVFVKQKQMDQSLDDFLGIKSSKVLQVEESGFEGRASLAWENINSTSTNSYSGEYSAFMTSDLEFGWSFDFEPLNQGSNESSVFVEGYFMSDNLNTLNLVMVVESEGNLIHYEAKDLTKQILKSNQWKHISLLYEVPAFKNQTVDIRFYLWNIGRASLYLDDISLRLIENKKVCQKENPKR